MTNQAGKSARKMAQTRRRTTLLMLIGLALVMLAGTLVLKNREALGLGAGAVLIFLIFLKTVPRIIDKPIEKRIKMARRADRGARGEEVVEGVLESLGEDYFIIHDALCPYGNIDHVVISKDKGVFLIETKAHGGKVLASDGILLINNKPPEKDFVAQTLRNTYWLKEKLGEVAGSSVWITPAIVFTNAFVTAHRPIKGIYILNKKYLPNLLQRVPKTKQGLSETWEKREDIGRIISG